MENNVSEGEEIALSAMLVPAYLSTSPANGDVDLSSNSETNSDSSPLLDKIRLQLTRHNS